MKKLMISTLVVLAALVVSLAAVSVASAGHPRGPAGYWDGDVNLVRPAGIINTGLVHHQETLPA